MCEGAWGRGGSFWGFVFSLTEEWFHPCQHVDFVQKSGRGGGRSFSWSHQLPAAASQQNVDVSIPAEGGCVHHRNPWVPKASLIPLSVLQKGKSGVMGGHQHRPQLTTPSWNKRRAEKHGMWEKSVPWTQARLKSQYNRTCWSFLSHFPYKTTLPWATLQLSLPLSTFPTAEFYVAHVPHKMLLPLWLSRGRALPSCGFQSM